MEETVGGTVSVGPVVTVRTPDPEIQSGALTYRLGDVGADWSRSIQFWADVDSLNTLPLNDGEAKTIDEARQELIAKIEQFVAAYNKTKAAPFNWTATADSILEKLQRLCSQISGTGH